MEESEDSRPRLSVVSIAGKVYIDEPTQKMIGAGVSELKKLLNENKTAPVGAQSIVRMVYRAMRAAR